MFTPSPTAFDQDFQVIRRTDLDRQLATLFRYWDAQPMERAEFVGWAWIVAAASDFAAHENPHAAIEQLQQERDQVHQAIVNKVVETANVDLHLVSKRMFLEWLSKTIEQHERHAA